MKPVYHLWLDNIRSFMIWVGLLKTGLTGLYTSPIHVVRNHLVQVYFMLREKGSSCCGKSGRETCFSTKETKTFQSFFIKKVYKINHHFHCDSKCIVYLLSCKECGLQYVDRFRLRSNNYKCYHRVALEGVTPKQKYFYQQMLSEDHHRLLEDFEIWLIDNTDSSDPTRREIFWMN